MNHVLQLFLTGEYTAGLQACAADPAPTAEDQRWAGACALNLSVPALAKTLLLRARAAGAAGAAVGLTSTYRVTSEHALARQTLHTIEPSALCPIDRALYWRETGLLRMLDDNLIGACEALEQAWACTFEDDTAAHISGLVAQSAAFLYGLRGLDHQAEQYLDEASEHANPALRAYVLSARGLRRGYLGRFQEAKEDFTAAWADADRIPAICAVLTYNMGLLAWLEGQITEAQTLLWQAATLARDGGERETEGYARLALSAAHLSAGQVADARAELARAQPLTITPHLVNLLTLRTAALQTCSDPVTATSALQRCAAAFEGSHRMREWAWAHLHLAEAHLWCNNPRAADEALSTAADAWHAMQGGTSLSAELRGLPKVQHHLRRSPRSAYTRILLASGSGAKPGPAHVILLTLGEGRLYVNGEVVTTKYARAVEILAYLLRHPGRSLEQIVTDLFEEDPKRAKNYVHQVRYALMQAVPGLTIPASAQRTYDVRWTNLTFRWDVLDLEQALALDTDQGVTHAAALYTGAFLPGADSEWAQRERADLTWNLLRAGLARLDAWLQAGACEQCVHLAERLLDIDPYNEALNALMIRLVRALNGDTTAQHTIARIAHHFEHELGEVPPELRTLRRELSDLN